MADSKGRKPGDANALILKLIAESAAMREQIETLEARIHRLESDVANLRKSTPSVRPAEGRRASKRPGPLGPPPLPRISTSMNAVKPAGGSRGFVDVSDIAELVESMPPPAPRPKK